MQVAGEVKPIIVVTNGPPGAALPAVDETVPLVQLTLTGTLVTGPAGE